MSLQHHLDNLRAKPEHVRRRIAFWSAGGLTALIFMFWLASFSITGQPARGTMATAVEKVGAPGQSMVAAVGSFFGDIRDLIWKPKRIEYVEIEAAPGPR